jgi:hypothetical protein
MKSHAAAHSTQPGHGGILSVADAKSFLATEAETGEAYRDIAGQSHP